MSDGTSDKSFPKVIEELKHSHHELLKNLHDILESVSSGDIFKIVALPAKVLELANQIAEVGTLLRSLDSDEIARAHSALNGTQKDSTFKPSFGTNGDTSRHSDTYKGLIALLNGVKGVGEAVIAIDTGTKISIGGRPPKDVPLNTIFIGRNELGDSGVFFNLQEGPIEENGVNGIQIDDLIYFTRAILSRFQKSHPCDENGFAIDALNQAVFWLKKRKEERLKRKVEGTNQI